MRRLFVVALTLSACASFTAASDPTVVTNDGGAPADAADVVVADSSAEGAADGGPKCTRTRFSDDFEATSADAAAKWSTSQSENGSFLRDTTSLSDPPDGGSLRVNLATTSSASRVIFLEQDVEDTDCPIRVSFSVLREVASLVPAATILEIATLDDNGKEGAVLLQLNERSLVAFDQEEGNGYDPAKYVSNDVAEKIFHRVVVIYDANADPQTTISLDGANPVGYPTAHGPHHRALLVRIGAPFSQAGSSASLWFDRVVIDAP